MHKVLPNSITVRLPTFVPCKTGCGRAKNRSAYFLHACWGKRFYAQSQRTENDKNTVYSESFPLTEIQRKFL